jgi:hypothetical protein
VPDEDDTEPRGEPAWLAARRLGKAPTVPKDPLVRWMIALAVAVSIGLPLAVALVLTLQ